MDSTLIGAAITGGAGMAVACVRFVWIEFKENSKFRSGIKETISNRHPKAQYPGPLPEKICLRLTWSL